MVERMQLVDGHRQDLFLGLPDPPLEERLQDGNAPQPRENTGTDATTTTSPGSPSRDSLWGVEHGRLEEAST